MKRLLLFLILLPGLTLGKEGMWLPQLLEQFNQSEMQQIGLQIPIQEIYSINQSSLKDAVVQFGGGCTGELISPHGLLVTNHHCGFSQIQSLSTIEKNYLEDGYWAKSYSEELPCPGLTVTFIREIRDVSSIVLKNLSDNLPEDFRAKQVKNRIDSLEKSISIKSIKGIVRSFYSGNEYFLFVIEVFTDIRFVGAPPVQLGKFGGETDNWVWPRHTCDFSLFRIYADSANHAADYSPKNVPFKASRFLTINIGEKKEGDYVMVYGFPGRTNEYLSSSSLDIIYSQTDPNRVQIREERLNSWRSAMYKNDTINLQYAAKFRTLENYYKKWKGEILGLKKFNVGQLKTDYESTLMKINPAIRPILDSLNFYNEQFKPLSFISDYYTEALSAVELIGLAGQYKNLVALCKTDTLPDSLISAEVNKLKAGLKGAYRNYSLATDKSVANALITMSLNKLKKENLPLDLKQFSYNNSGLSPYIEKMYAKSIFRDSVSAFDFLSHFSRKKIKKLKEDPAYRLYSELSLLTVDLQGSIDKISASLNRFQRMYFAELRKTDSSRRFYPDANSTLRLSYGKIQSMSPVDGKIYNWYTTADGLLEKFDNTNPDFKMPERMVGLLKAKDYGRFGNKGVLPVAFISSLHTTGGNSGSPVLDAKGQLVGINYDRVWEGIMSDLYYDETYCRNIALDVRYFLFVVEKYGNATRLTEEMTIVGN